MGKGHQTFVGKYRFEMIMDKEKWVSRMKKRRDLIDSLLLETGLGSVEVVGMVNDIMEGHLTYEQALIRSKQTHSVV